LKKLLALKITFIEKIACIKNLLSLKKVLALKNILIEKSSCVENYFN
jgi:hypothetical protein